MMKNKPKTPPKRIEKLKFPRLDDGASRPWRRQNDLSSRFRKMIEEKAKEERTGQLDIMAMVDMR